MNLQLDVTSLHMRYSAMLANLNPIRMRQNRAAIAQLAPTNSVAAAPSAPTMEDGPEGTGGSPRLIINISTVAPAATILRGGESPEQVFDRE